MRELKKRNTMNNMEQIVRKNGLLYTPDMHTVIGVDTETDEFKGRIPFGAHYIDEEVFTECPYEKMDIPDSVVGIGVALFKDSPNLKSVKLPEKVTELPPYLFSGCRSLTRVKMPNVVYSFPEGLFQNCSSLEDIPFRAGIRELSPYVCEGCSSLVSLVIPPTVEYIQERAAADCTKLATVVLPEALRELDPSAFDGCPNIHSIRISEDNPRFYVSEIDGCLYERTSSGDKLRLSVAGFEKPVVNLYKENVDDETESFFTDEDLYEDDDVFSAEIPAGDADAEPDLIDREIAAASGLETVQDNIAEDTIDEIGSSSKPAGSVSQEELLNLFGGGSSEHAEEEDDSAVTVKITDSKTNAILESVGLSRVIECEPAGEPPADSDLFVIAEILDDSQGSSKSFTKKLEAVAMRFAQIKDFKRIFMIYGLPVDNDEFMEFYKLYVSNRNVVFACQASNASELSEYGRKICEYSRIDISAAALAEQKKNITIKNNTLIKLVLKDKK